MGFSDYANTSELQNKNAGLTKKLGSQADLNTAEGIRDYAASKGVSINEPQPPISRTALSTALDALMFTSRKAGEVLQNIQGRKEIDPSLTPSEVLFGKAPEQKSFGDALKYQLTTVDGLKRLAVDVVTDPLTYVTLGTGSAIKVGLSTGTKVAVTKTGKEMIKDLAEEMVEKGVSRKIAIDRAKSEVGRRIESGIPGLKAEPSIKFAGKEVVKLPKFGKVYEGFSKALDDIPATRPLIQGLEGAAKLTGKLFIRDFGLPEQFIPIKQKFIDTFDAANGSIKNDIKTVFSGTTKDERVKITNALDKGTIHELPPKLRTLAQRTKDVFARIAKEEEERGLLDKTIEDYVTHIYDNPAKAKSIIQALRQGQPSALLRFNKTRVLQDLDEAKALGLKPKEDIAELLYIRSIASERAKLTQDFVKETAKKFGKVPQEKDLTKLMVESKDILVKFGDVATGVPKEFRDIYLPQNIAEDIAKIGERFFANEEAKGLLRGYDKIINFWKGSVTVLFPAFHFRNGITNTINNFLDIGQSAFNPAVHKKVTDILLGGEGKIVTDLGEEISYEEIRQLAKTNQVFQDTLNRTDVGRILDTNIMQKANIFDLGRKVGRSIENEARMTNFLVNLKRGHGVEDAAARTKQFLFDYDNLSLFEKDVLRRAIPFYTWTRKNIALQIKMALTAPGKQSGVVKALETINDMFGHEPTEEEKKFTPDYIAQGLNILLEREGDDRTFLVGFDLPFEDAVHQIAGFADNPFKHLMNQMAPFIKAPVEIGTGKSLFTDKEISEDDSGIFAKNLPQPIRDWLDYSERHVKTKGGEEFDVVKVDPQKKWIFKNVTSFLGVGRLTAATTVDGMAAIYKFGKGEPLTLQDKSNILRLFTALNVKTTSIEAEKARQEKQQIEEASNILERKGEVGEFKIRFVPKGGGLEKKL